MIKLKIEDNRFVVTYCDKCSEIIWPQSEFCNKCFSSNSKRKISTVGILLEFSKKNDSFFGLAEFEGNIRLIGKLHLNQERPYEGMKIKLTKCELVNDNYSFVLSSI